ncbi:Sulfate adenylyltransferase [Gracilariopsis chorda]|uniref:Sulfate adenylyltransferase n=1 Tax=Gracilariopsis chorda TaxID=448386 RepID=A0A2V3J135_9FLOR|nr:Sulfate adenylyltransferase [Gracilariopsis chorda]|eukprot:PXF48074.1 Sulfate adenylyltransferase [Gracilariopsis chorda]
MATISPVHGGGELVDRIVQEIPDAETLPKVVVNDVDMTSLYRIADGTLSPLTGPMVKDDYDTVLTSKHIVRDEKKWAWTIPICLPVTAEEARVSPEGAKVALFSESSAKVFGVLEVKSLFEWDKAAFIKAVYGTERVDHPGARLWMNDDRSTMIGGPISLLPFEDSREFVDRIFSPKKMRAYLKDKEFGASIAFQTRNPLHRAHEYALVYGAESLIKSVGDEKKVGVFLNPLVGQLKGDDVPAKTRMDTYVKLIEGGFLGEGDMDEELWKSKNQDLKNQVTLAGLDMRMFYGGPSEAVMHSIYRQNLGLTHFIIGRKHADAPFDDKSAIWGDFDAQEVFSNLGGELSIKTVNVGFAAYFEELGRVGLVSENKGKKSVSISGTKVREMLNRGERPDERVMRPTTSDILIEYYKEKNTMKA